MCDYESDQSFQKIAKNRNPVPNNFKCAYTLESYLEENCSLTLEQLQALVSGGLLPATAEFLEPHEDHRSDFYHPDWVAFSLYPFTIGFKFPFPQIVNEFFASTGLVYTQLMPDGWRVLAQFEIYKSRGKKVGLKELAYGFDLRSYGSRQFGFRQKSKRGVMVIRSDPKDRKWKHEFFFVKRTSLGGEVDLPTKPLRYARSQAPKLEVLFPAVKKVTEANYKAIVDLSVEKKTLKLPHVEAVISTPSQSQTISQNLSKMSTMSRTTRSQEVNLDMLLAEADSVHVKKEKLGKAPVHVGERHSARLLKAATSKKEGEGIKKRKVEVVELDDVEVYAKSEDAGLMLSKAMTLVQKAADQIEKDAKQWKESCEEKENKCAKLEKERNSLKNSNKTLMETMQAKNNQIVEANKLLLSSQEDFTKKLEKQKQDHEIEMGEQHAELKGMLSQFVTEARVRMMKEFLEGKAQEWDLSKEEEKLRRLKGEEVDPEEVNSACGPVQNVEEDKSKWTAEDVKILYGSLSNAPKEVQEEVAQEDLKSADHTKWIGAFHRKQDFIDVVEAIFRGAMKGKLIVNCPLPPERIPKFQLLYKDV